GGRDSLLSTASRESVQTEIKLTDAQKTSIRELGTQVQGDRNAFQAMQGLSSEERAAFMERMGREREERTKVAEIKLKEVLTSEQYTRVEQLFLQRAGVNALSRD